MTQLSWDDGKYLNNQLEGFMIPKVTINSTKTKQLKDRNLCEVGEKY